MDNPEVLYDRYARALFRCADETGTLHEVMEEFASCGEEWLSDKRFHDFFTHPLITKKEKKEVMRAIDKKEKFRAIILHLLELLVDNKREALLRGIFTRFRDLYELSQNKTKVYVETATALSEREQEEFAQALAKRFKSRVRVKTKENDRLIGGFCIRYRDILYDASIRKQLTRLREALT